MFYIYIHEFQGVNLEKHISVCFVNKILVTTNFEALGYVALVTHSILNRRLTGFLKKVN